MERGLWGWLANGKALYSIGFWGLVKGWAVQKTGGLMLTIYARFCTWSWLLKGAVIAPPLKFLVVLIFSSQFILKRVRAFVGGFLWQPWKEMVWLTSSYLSQTTTRAVQCSSDTCLLAADCDEKWDELWLYAERHCKWCVVVLPGRCIPLCCVSISWTASLQTRREGPASCVVNARRQLTLLNYLLTYLPPVNWQHTSVILLI